jgi:hypothetical protein
VAFWWRVEGGGLRVEREDVAVDELGRLKSSEFGEGKEDFSLVGSLVSFDMSNTCINAYKARLNVLICTVVEV